MFVQCKEYFLIIIMFQICLDMKMKLSIVYNVYIFFGVFVFVSY